VCAIARLERLVLAVDALLHHLDQAAVGVGGQQRVPARAPDHLDHVPAGAPEAGLELLDDLAVTTTRIGWSRWSRPASAVAPTDSGSSISPSPRSAPTWRPSVWARPRAWRYF